MTPRKAEVAPRNQVRPRREGLEAKAPCRAGEGGAHHRLLLGAGATTPNFDALALIAEATGKPLSYFVAEDKPAADGDRLAEAVNRVEAAADSTANRSASRQRSPSCAPS